MFEWRWVCGRLDEWVGECVEQMEVCVYVCTSGVGVGA